jgi:alkyldihydroxyacetonephosphate synthase
VGELKLPPLPASAAGPDLGQLILGSEGRFGIITQATVRLRRRPQREGFYAAFFRDWPSGVGAVREMAQLGVAVSMLRLSDARETETTLALAGRERLMAWADRGLRLFRYGPERCLLIYGVTGDHSSVARARRQTKAIARSHGGLPVGSMIGETWRKSRFLAPYLRNTLWERGYALDTLETAVPWSKVLETAAAIKAAIKDTMEHSGERVLVFAHLSHVYGDGASIYITYLFRRAADPYQTLDRWRLMKSAASQVVIAHVGTISHQHGVGSDHAPYLEAEKGKIGIDWLEAMRRAIDPDEILNPGKLLMRDGDQQPVGANKQLLVSE